MTDIVRPDRVRFIAVKAATMRQMFNNHETLASEVEARAHLEDIETLLAEIKRLRAALRTCPCPGGGWNGMPAYLEPTVAACVDNKVCGCVYGAALSDEQLTREED